MRRAISSSLLVATIAATNVAGAAELEEIIVTAQYKQQSLQDAGLAVDAVSAKGLTEAGITNAYDLSQLIPALTIASGGGISSQLYMRGVGNRANNGYLDPAVIVTYDGVPLARGSGAAMRAFFDVERVEVLKGPQGTLYGKNATGGVINLLPVKPVLGETEGFVGGSFGNYGSMELSGALNLPVGENSAVRFAASSVEHDGYNNDGTNDEDQTSFRGQFYTEFNDSVSLRIAADYSDVGGVGNGTTPIGRYQGMGLANYTFIPNDLPLNEGSDTPLGNAYRTSILSAPGFGFLTPIQDEWFTDAKIQGVNAELKWATAWGDLTVIPSWRKTENETLFGHPGFNSGWFNTEAEQTSLEMRLQGTGEGLIQDYIFGAYLFDEEVKGNNTFNQEFVLPLQDYVQEGDSKAVFGQLTWGLSESTRLITGIRFTDDHKEINGQIDNFITFCGGLGPAFVTPPASFALGCQIPGNLPRFPTLDTVEQAEAFLINNGWAAAFIPIPPGELIPLRNGVGQILHAITRNEQEYDRSRTTYRISLEHDFGEDSMVYAAFETGYRSGGLQPSSQAIYQPEFLDAFTIGSKNRLANGRLQINAELFYWDYQDQQISYFTLSEAGVLENLTDNVGKATSKGFDVDLKWLATDNTLISSKVQYLDASYDDLHFETGPPRDNINCPFTIVGAQSNGAPALDFNCSDNQAIYSPEWTFQLGVEQTFPLGDMNVIANLNTTWVDDQVTGFTNLPHEIIESHWTTNFSLTLASAEDKWSVTAWVRNLEDENRLRSSQAPLLGMALAQYGPDQTYGLRMNYNF